MTFIHIHLSSTIDSRPELMYSELYFRAKTEEALAEYASCKLLIKTEFSREIENHGNRSFGEKEGKIRWCWCFLWNVSNSNVLLCYASRSEICDLRTQITRRCIPKSHGCFRVSMVIITLNHRYFYYIQNTNPYRSHYHKLLKNEPINSCLVVSDN